MSEPPWEALGDRLLGAKIVLVEDVGNGHVRIEWEHHGTDDDIGCATLPIAAFCFCSGPVCDSCWKADDSTTETAKPSTPPADLPASRADARGN